MRIGDCFPSKYLAASDLPFGRDVHVVIAGVQMELMEREKKMKPVVHFQGKDKGLVLNQVNANSISDVAGTDKTTLWSGHAVILYATTTDFGGKMVPCIRVKRPAPVAAPVAPPQYQNTAVAVDDNGVDETPF